MDGGLAQPPVEAVAAIHAKIGRKEAMSRLDRSFVWSTIGDHSIEIDDISERMAHVAASVGRWFPTATRGKASMGNQVRCVERGTEASGPVPLLYAPVCPAAAGRGAT